MTTMKRYADHEKKRIGTQPAEWRELIEVPMTKQQFWERVGNTTHAFKRAFIGKVRSISQGKRSASSLDLGADVPNNIEEAYYWFALEADRFMQAHGRPVVQPQCCWEYIDAGYIAVDAWLQPLPVKTWWNMSRSKPLMELLDECAEISPKVYESRWNLYLRPRNAGKGHFQPIGEIEVMSGKFNGWYYGIQPKTLDEKIPHCTTFEAVKKAMVQHINHEYFFGPGSSHRPPEVQLIDKQDFQGLGLN
jgi:hypothetical protein